MSAGYVYLIRNGDLYKIGHTSNLERRLKQLQPCVLVQSLITDRSLNLEQELHKRFQGVRLPQSEYFRLNPHQVEQVRLALGWKKPQNQPAQKPTGWKRPSQPLPEPKLQATHCFSQPPKHSKNAETFVLTDFSSSVSQLFTVQHRPFAQLLVHSLHIPGNCCVATGCLEIVLTKHQEPTMRVP